MSSYFVGLDLGQSADYSALVVAERVERENHDPAMVRTITETIDGPSWNNYGNPFPVYREQVTRTVLLQPDGSYEPIPSPDEPVYDVRYIRRWKLGTSYPTIVNDTVELMQREPLNQNATLVIDATGVGRPVVDMITQHPRTDFAYGRVLITGGNTATLDAGFWHVPKRDLVGAVQVCLQNRRLRIAASLPEAATLTAELANFQTKININTAHDSYGAWREGQHDDLVLSLAMALWYAERATINVGWL